MKAGGGVQDCEVCMCVHRWCVCVCVKVCGVFVCVCEGLFVCV